MDKSDADSNYSDLSEDQSSNISTLSGLSDYKNEFLELKHLIDPSKYTKLTTISQKGSNNQFYENTIRCLQNELEHCKRFNEKSQRDNEIKYNEKIEILIKQNRELDRNLDGANKQIQRLLDSFPLKTTNNLERKVVLLEKENHDLNTRNLLLNNEITQHKQQINDLLLENCDFKRKLNETNLELNTRHSCAVELKDKITKQYIDLQNLHKNNLNLTNSINNLSNELEYLKKSEIWYKQQLHDCQDGKQQLSNEIHELKQINVVNIEKIDNLHLELTKWQCKCDEIQLKSLKEKEEILHKFETITNNNCNDSGFINDHYDINYYETIIKELHDEIERIKMQIQQNSIEFAKVNKENSALITKCLLLQKYQQQKENEIERFINDEKSLKMQLSLSLDKEQSLRKQIDELTSIGTSLKIDLLKKNQENGVIEDSIQTVKEQFRILKRNYADLKNQSDKQLKDNLQLMNDKQQLFMSNNWKICELNQCRNLEREIKDLQEKLLVLIQQNNQFKHDNLRLFDENADLKRSLKDKDNNLELLKHNVDELKQQIQQQHQNVYLSNPIEILENLKNICGLFEINCETKPATPCGECIKILLEKLEQHCKIIVVERQNFKQIWHRIDSSERRCSELKKRTDENFQLLQITSFKNSDDEAVGRLKVLLEVKVREQKDKQKRYEKNYSLLLRKVKEHMKYRNSAEKHNRFLQEMNNSIWNECNDLKLLIESKNYEIQELKTTIANYKQTVLNLERKIDKNELEIDEKQLKQTEETQQQDRIDEERIRNEINMKDSTIDSLKQMNQTLILENSKLLLQQQQNDDNTKFLNETITNLSDEITNLQKHLNKTATNTNGLHAKLDEENGNYRKLFAENQHLICELNDNKQRNTYLTSELKLLQSNLQQKSEEFDELQAINQNSEKTYIEEVAKLQNVIFNLKTQLQTHISDVDLLKKQKFFLQRLCNDLKIALRFHVNHCKVLQEKLIGFRRNKSELNLAEIPTNPPQYDDEYIEKLLEKSQLLNSEDCLADVKQSLDGLRTEISLLQKQLQCT